MPLWFSAQMSRPCASDSPTLLSPVCTSFPRCPVLVETSCKDDGRERIYTLRPAQFAQLRAWVEDIEAFWTVQLASFKDHVERTRGKK